MRVFNTYKAHITLDSLNASDSIIAKKMAIQGMVTDKKIDAICCTDDITALLAKQTADYLGIKPLITGFDGTRLIQSLFPSLITARQPIQELAELMSDLLISRIVDPERKLNSIYTLPVQLINQL